MAEANKERENRATQAMQQSNFPRDLLQRYHNQRFPKEERLELECGEIELSLGLSLNGRFGIDPRRSSNKLTRSSSIPDFLIPIPRDKININGSSSISRCDSSNNTSLILRTRSLPVETADEWRKRKELQTLRRLEAKRKRSEKKKAAKNRGLGEEINGLELLDTMVVGSNNKILPFQWANNGLGGGGGGAVSPGSIGSQGSGSSAISDFENQSVQGTNKGTEEKSPASLQPLLQNDQKPPLQSTSIDQTRSVPMEINRSNKPTTVTNKQANEVRDVLEDMPCVSTKGSGPNGKRIEGFLYRYRKGEEVRIVCVCHGSFLSPAEFVKHAGGGDVAQPLKHIVVAPSSLM